MRISLPEQYQNRLNLDFRISLLPVSLAAHCMQSHAKTPSLDRCQLALTTIRAASKQPHATPHGLQQSVVIYVGRRHSTHES